jgi:hypothetical protein
MCFDPTMSFFHFGPKERKMSGWLEVDLKNFRVVGHLRRARLSLWMLKSIRNMIYLLLRRIDN